MFLPILIFEAALMLSTREFMRNIVPIGALATAALVISAVFVGISLNIALGMSLTALLFAADLYRLGRERHPRAASNWISQADVDQALLHRRQAQALSRITVREVLFELVSSGVLEASAAEDAAVRIGDEVGGPR